MSPGTKLLVLLLNAVPPEEFAYQSTTTVPLIPVESGATRKGGLGKTPAQLVASTGLVGATGTAFNVSVTPVRLVLMQPVSTTRASA